MIIPAGFCQVNLKFGGIALPNGAEMTFGIVDTVSSASTIAAFVAAEYQTANIDQAQSSEAALVAVRVKKGPNATGAFAEVPANVPGTNATQAVPPNVSALIEKTTAFGGRQGSGRMFFPGIPESQVLSNGALLSAFVSLLEAGWQAFQTAMETAGHDLVLLHTIAGNDPDVLADLTVDPTVATQRRRLRR